MQIKTIDREFATTGQVTPADLAAIADAGYKAIVCARPDGEEAGQPDFATVAEAAKAHGIVAVHIPVSGPLGDGQVIRFHEAWRDLPRPVLGYCRSGARAGSLYATLER
ncbi:TIGR01244 family phosphatase [Arsenicitalea aurantiaca]|uniref:TIGR01244 family phosphatase n=1 Tax=Arsenicitalea aurantiaca TaxID=1783274 RepID=A0A433XFD1_9HYPH|nr:TIGR01244 family sulfur transferase [Arsenicitalea aurantiaca]RUT32795.1 TIGR01244 family phosphatase [Arsenicitalea aurantiaca]